MASELTVALLLNNCRRTWSGGQGRRERERERESQRERERERERERQREAPYNGSARSPCTLWSGSRLCLTALSNGSV
jgi:hypothetical protein